MSASTFPSVRSVTHSSKATPGELTAARELARALGLTAIPGELSSAARGSIHLSVATRELASQVKLPAEAAGRAAWTWLRVTEDGTGEIVATHGSFLFAAVRLLLSQGDSGPGGLNSLTREKLARGVFLPATFGWHRPHWDACFTGYWRCARDFDPEHYVASLAEAGFTHVEVNALQAHMPYEDTVPWEYYPQFYTYAPGFNHFIATPLTAGIWPAHYLDANLTHLKKLAALGRNYGLKPSVCMFEPRTLPERFFQKYPSLRGARVDHPFRSRLPRYTMAQDHPIAQRHYREALQALIRAVPDLSCMSVWANDSGAGFEHTASLYVGRNGGPYLIREWRNHDKVAEAAGQSIVRYLQNLRTAAAELNPEFDVVLRIESFKVEHEQIVAGMGPHVTWEAPSLLVRGYSLPYSHPKYPENKGIAGSIFHTALDPTETEVVAKSRARGIDPVLQYSATAVWNQEPLLGMPFPRFVHAKLLSARSAGVNRVSALGGLSHTAKSPYNPNQVAIQAAQFFPDESIETVLRSFATRLVGEAHATTLVEAWRQFEDALIWQPLVPLYCAFGFCWQRTWDRPLVPDIEAIPAAERDYYERHGCFQHNNPGLNDLGKDVLFDLITRESGAKMAADMDKELLPRLRRLIAALDAQIAALPTVPESSNARAVFIDLRDRTRGYLYWAGALRAVCAWCADVYGYLAAQEAGNVTAQATHTQNLQTTIDLDLVNTRGLLELIETSSTEFMVVSGVSESTFLYGENLADHLRTKIRLTEKYRHHAPRIDREVYWRPVPGSTWPEGW